MPDAYLLDTSILVHYVRDDALKQRIEAEHHLLTGDTAVTISAVTVGELESLSRQWNWGEANL